MIRDTRNAQSNDPCNFFSHPDYTVGFGIAPNQPPKWVADYTAGKESHLAPKNCFYLVAIVKDVFTKSKCFLLFF